MFAFCLVAIGPFLAAIMQIPYLTLKIEGQGHDENQSKSNVIDRLGSLILLKMKAIRKVVQRLPRVQKSVVGGGGGVRIVTKNIVNPGKPGWLDIFDLDNGLLPARRQAIITTNGDFS